MFRGKMALSNDPEKRARSLANLRKGPAKAAENFGLPVVGYDEAEPVQATPPGSSKNSRRGPVSDPAVATSSNGPSVLLVVGGGIALLVLLVVVLNKTPGGSSDPARYMSRG
jgi:hypothetical protein